MLRPWCHLSEKTMKNMSQLFSGIPALVVICLLFPPLSSDACGEETSQKTQSKVDFQAVQVRGNLDRSRATFAETRRGTVVFMGGSITEMNGYRPMVCEALRERFPQTEFKCINAGIASTCSHTGAFRMPTDVLAHHPDLLLIEFAVNDDQDAGHSYQDAVRGMEGIVRAARAANPNVDILITHFVNPAMLDAVQHNRLPTSIRAHEAVAKHYGIPSCNVAVELAKQIASGQTTWKTYGGVHPKPAGNRIAANLVEQVFDAVDYSARQNGGKQPDAFAPRELPPPIDPASFAGGCFLGPSHLELGDGWQSEEPDWKQIAGSFRSRFGGRPLTIAEKPGAEIKLHFRGTAVGLYVLAGPDAGTVEFSIDGGPWQERDLYHHYSKGLHYPRTVVLASGLPSQEHEVRLRVAKSKNEASSGHAVRVLEFVADCRE